MVKAYKQRDMTWSKDIRCTVRTWCFFSGQDKSDVHQPKLFSRGNKKKKTFLSRSSPPSDDPSHSRAGFRASSLYRWYAARANDQRRTARRPCKTSHAFHCRRNLKLVRCFLGRQKSSDVVTEKHRHESAITGVGYGSKMWGQLHPIAIKVSMCSGKKHPMMILRCWMCSWAIPTTPQLLPRSLCADTWSRVLHLRQAPSRSKCSACLGTTRPLAVTVGISFKSPEVTIFSASG